MNMRRLRILYVAYPLQPVSEASAGGAEQVLSTLEAEMHARGHQTTVAACADSHVAGELLETVHAPAIVDDFERANREHTQRVLRHIEARRPAGQPFDMVH